MGCATGLSAHCTIVVHALYCHPPLDECVWKASTTRATRRELAEAPDPTLYRSQYTIFSIGNDVVLTVRKNHSEEESWSPVCSTGEPNDSTPVFPSLGSDVNVKTRSTAKGHCMWDDLRERIRCGDADLRVNSSSAKYIAFSTLEVIMEHNYRLRDILRKWLHDLEDAIQCGAQSSHTVHLYEFSKLASAYVDELSAIGECLGDICPRSGNAPNPKAAAGPPQRSSSDGIDGVLAGLRDEDAHVLEDTSLSAFFENEYIFFKDLADEVQTICSEVDMCEVQRLLLLSCVSV